jgi:anti-sigma B factor antagonist
VSGEFNASAGSLDDAIGLVVVVGDADLFTAPELRRALETALDGGAEHVLVDLSQATFIDSTMLAVLMEAVRRLRPRDGEVGIVCVEPNILRIFEITLLDRAFRIFPDSRSGLRYFRDVRRSAPSAAAAPSQPASDR